MVTQAGYLFFPFFFKVTGIASYATYCYLKSNICSVEVFACFETISMYAMATEFEALSALSFLSGVYCFVFSGFYLVSIV